MYFIIRGVAQFGRALRSGRRGRRFESCRLDQFLDRKWGLIPTFGQFLCRFKVLALHFLKFAIFTTTCVPQFFMYCKPLFFGLCVVIFAPQIYLSFQKNYINQLNIAYLAVAIFCKKILECGMKNVGLR